MPTVGANLFDPVALARERYWAAMEAEVYCDTATELTIAQIRTAECKTALAAAKAAAMDTLNAAVRVWR